jgi:hypothetical protein
MSLLLVQNLEDKGKRPFSLWIHPKDGLSGDQPSPMSIPLLRRPILFLIDTIPSYLYGVFGNRFIMSKPEIKGKTEWNY